MKNYQKLSIRYRFYLKFDHSVLSTFLQNVLKQPDFQFVFLGKRKLNFINRYEKITVQTAKIGAIQAHGVCFMEKINLSIRECSIAT